MINSQTTKAKADTAKRQPQGDKGYLDLARKGSLHSMRRTVLTRKPHHLSPYSQPSDKPSIRPRELKPQTTDPNLTHIEERRSKLLRLTRNQSFTETLSDSSCGPSLALRHKSPQDDSTDTAVTLSKRLNEQLKATGQTYDVKERFKAFQSAFLAVIAVDSAYGIILRRIKAGYEEYISQCAAIDNMQETEKIVKQLLEFQELLEQEQAEKGNLLNTITGLRKDKTALSTKLMEKTATVKALEKTIGDLSQTTKSSPKEEQEDSEKSTLRDMVSNLQDEVTLLRSREQLLLTVLKSAKHQGFPIDEIIKMQTRLKKSPREPGKTLQSRMVAAVPRLNLAATMQLGQLSPISRPSEREDLQSDYRDSLTSFAKEIDLSVASNREGSEP